MVQVPPYVHLLTIKLSLHAHMVQVPPYVQLLPAAAFGTAALVNSLSWCFETHGAKRKLRLLVIYVNFVALVFAYASWRGTAAVYVNAATGRPLSIMR